MRKKLGQHFLKNKRKIKKIIDLLELKESDKVLEIGPGKGALTKEIGERGKNLKIIAVEQDKNLIEYLKSHLVSKVEKNGNILEVQYGNILTKLPPLSKKIDDFNEYKIVGNIPYYITGKLFRVFEKIDKKPERIVLTIQKEVADRLTSKPPEANILSSSVQFWAETEKVMNIPKKDFSPVPGVDSSVIVIKPKKQKLSSSKNYYKTLKILFKHPRKTILNNLSLGLELEKNKLEKKLNKINLKPGNRPQNLEVDEIKELSSLLYNK